MLRVVHRVLITVTSLAATFGLFSVRCDAAAAQEGPAGFPVQEFNAREAVARWMAAYDGVAWISTDSLRALPPAERQGLGPEWFCYERAGVWHAVYGRYDAATDSYHEVAHFVQAGSGFQHTTERADSAEAAAFGRALHAARTRLPTLIQSRVALNQFVRHDPQQRIEVWLMPGWQPAGYLLHGMEWRYTFDPSGRMLADSSVTGRGLYVVRPDTATDEFLDDTAFVAPRVSSLFLLLTWGRGFRHLYVETQRFRSTLFRHGQTEAWLHVVRQTAPQGPGR